MARKDHRTALARRRLSAALAAISAERSLAAASARVADARGILPALINAAVVELRLSSDLSDKDGIKERIATRLARLEIAAGRDMNRGTGLLATIGATAPFVGLFGTVWGIMNSFVGISKAQTTNLAIVAPGIAEALLATAVGLFAAIPAVIIYNQFARSIGGYRALLGDASAEVLRLVSRDLDRRTRASRHRESGGVTPWQLVSTATTTIRRELHEINVTPFIDVMLVLLIIFMVAAPLSTVDVGVDLPVSTAKPQPRPDKPLFLTIKADLTLALGNDLIARGQLAQRSMRQRKWIARSDCFCAPTRACPMAN